MLQVDTRVPMVVGYPYLEAMAVVRAAGFQPSRVAVTRPPRAWIGLGRLRVIQQRGLDMTLAYENYEDPRPR